MMKKLPFEPADILIPKENHEKWSVVACDQYTSERGYWERVKDTVGDAPSALKLILPEVYLNDGDTEQRTEKINETMSEYLENGIFTEYKNSLVFVERTLADGRVRRGIVGKIDLDGYDYGVGSKSPVRATEGTVLSRIPPRVKIRENAPLELPHIMILIDDPEFSVIPGKPDGEILYDFDLMENGGHLRGSLMSENAVNKALDALRNKMADREDPLIFAVGDGNHSLATAKACAAEGNELSGYALAEIVNIHDTALDFEPIYRVMFGVDADDVVKAAVKRFAGCGEKKVTCLTSAGEREFFVDGLPADTLQKFIDDYISDHKGAGVDYIHGESSVRSLIGKDSVGFLFDGIGKDELFGYVEKNGSLPRKTFSMGEANDKRYYMECRKIR